MAELEITELTEKPLLEERVKDYPKVQWLLDKYADKAYPIVDKHDIEAVLTELLDDIDRWKGAYKIMEINFNNECDSHAADNERNEKRIKEMEDSLRNMCRTGQNDWAGEMYRAADVDEKIAQLNETILRLEALVPNYNEELTRLVNEMNIPEVSEMFYRYIQEGEKLKGDFTKADEFISKIETIRNLSFKKDNEQDYWLDWNNEIKNYRTSLERYKKIWSNG